MGKVIYTVPKINLKIFNSIYKGIPGMADPGGLPSMGPHRVRHD